MRTISSQQVAWGCAALGLFYFIYNLAAPVAPTAECGTALASLRDSLAMTIREEMQRKDRQLSHLPTIYVVTATYRRQEQIPELTRLAQTLMNVPKIHWIVADDTTETNPKVVRYLALTGLLHTYLLTPMPAEYRNMSVKPKGVANRNGAMQWVREHATDGVVYFADDDNTYDLRLFEEMRYTRRVSMWPVGLVTGGGLSSPVLRNGHFIGWYDTWIGGRKYPVDMASFAVSVQYLLKVPDAQMPYKPGLEEDGFLKSLSISPSDIEFKANGCTQIYVWHTQTKRNPLSSRAILDPRFNNTNLRILQENIMLKPA